MVWRALSLVRLWHALCHSSAGLRLALRQETAFQQEVLLTILLVPVAFYCGTSAIKIALMLISLVVVLIVELLNSALEKAVDYTGTSYHLLAKQAKDFASAAVLLSLIMAVGIWLWGVV